MAQEKGCTVLNERSIWEMFGEEIENIDWEEM